jgi:hypothetical protein
MVALWILLPSFCAIFIIFAEIVESESSAGIFATQTTFTLYNMLCKSQPQRNRCVSRYVPNVYRCFRLF